MFKQGRYTALMLFIAFAFKLLVINLSLISSLSIPQGSASQDLKKTLPSQTTKHASYDNPAAYDSQNEVSEEADEDDSNENLEKVNKYPAISLALSSGLNGLSALTGKASQCACSDAKLPSKTYIDLLVLRI